MQKAEGWQGWISAANPKGRIHFKFLNHNQTLNTDLYSQQL